MIVLPNPQAAKDLLAALEAGRPERAPGIHASEVIHCLRRSWYDRHEPIPHDEETRAMFLLGHSHHAILQIGHPAGTEIPVRISYPEGELLCTIDKWEPGSLLWDGVTEIKTTRRYEDKEPAYAMPEYLEQLATYCIALGKRKGRIVVWHIWEQPPSFKVWDVEFTIYDLQRWQKELHRRFVVVQSDVEPDTGQHRKGECEYCPYYRRNKRGGSCKGGPGYPSPFFLPDNPPSWMESGEHAK